MMLKKKTSYPFLQYAWKGVSVKGWIIRFTLLVVFPVTLSTLVVWGHSGLSLALEYRLKYLSICTAVMIGLLSFLWLKYKKSKLMGKIPL